MDHGTLALTSLFVGLLLAALYARRTIRAEKTAQYPVLHGIGVATLLALLTARLVAHTIWHKE